MPPDQPSPIAGLSRSTTFSRVMLGIGANAVGKLWVVGLQFLTVPILVAKWGTNGYGVWLMLAAVPTYVGLSDIGFGTAGAVDMTKRVAVGDRQGALAAFQSVWAFVTAVSAILLAAAVAAWLVYGALAGRADRDVADAALLLVILALFVLQMNLLNIAFRSLGRYAQGTFYFDLVFLAEGVSILVVALCGGRFTAAAAVMLFIRLVSCAVYYFRLRRLAPWVGVGWSHASLYEIRALAHPAFAAMGLPFSTALNIQGVVFIIGIALSPVAAAVFGTVRTISRMPIQVVGILTRASLPEITIAHAQHDHFKLSRLVGSNIVAVAIVTAPAAVVVILFGPAVLSLLSQGKLAAPLLLFPLMAIVMVLQTLWNTVASFLSSLNLQHRFSYVYAVLSLAACVLAYVIAKSLGLTAVAVLMLGVDVIMTAVVIVQWNRISAYSWRSCLVIVHAIPAMLGRAVAALLRKT